MAEVINTNVFDANKKFVDFAGLDYFWEKAKAYVEAADKVVADKVATLEGVVGDSTNGLVKEVASLRTEVNALGGAEGGIQGMIDASIAALDLPNTYDANGAAATAEQNAKAYADGKFQVAGDYEAAGTAAGLNAAMDARVKVLEAIDHDQLAADASAAAVATVLDGAPEKFDTLKEVAQWIADSESAATAADLVTRVKALEDIDHDAYVAADEQVLADAKSYVDGKVDGKFDAAGSAATAEQNAKAYADGKFQVAGDYEAAGTAAGLVNGLANGAVKANTDAISVINGAGEGSIAKAKADAIADAEAKLKAVTDTLKSAAFVEVATLEATMDSKDATNLAAAKTYAATYTDNLFDSFQFAANSDIDTLFA